MHKFFVAKSLQSKKYSVLMTFVYQQDQNEI